MSRTRAITDKSPNVKAFTTSALRNLEVTAVKVGNKKWLVYSDKLLHFGIQQINHLP